MALILMHSNEKRVARHQDLSLRGGLEKAVFLDKDGTFIENMPYNIDPEKIKLYKDVPEALKLFKKHGFKIIVITNQSGVAYGYFTEKDVLQVRTAIECLLAKYSISMDGFYYCPHHAEGNVKEYAIECSCRKPKPGMMIQASKDLKIDLSKSWMVGDILHDVEAGNRAGCKTVLIDNGNETEWVLNKKRNPTYTVKSMKEAAAKILRHEANTVTIKREYERGIEKSGRKV